MKKKIFAVILIAVLSICVAMPAFATDGFNKGVFDTVEDITVEDDDMTGIVTVSSTSLNKGRNAAIDIDWSTVVTIRPHISVSKDLDAYSFSVGYVADSWAFIDEMIIKIGDNRYTFSDLDVSRNVRSSGSIQESFVVFMNSDVNAMMQDLIEHREDEIKIRLRGSRSSVDFVLSKNIKDAMIHLYNVFAAGGGINQTNMKILDVATSFTVEVN